MKRESEWEEKRKGEGMRRKDKVMRGTEWKREEEKTGEGSEEEYEERKWMRGKEKGGRNEKGKTKWMRGTEWKREEGKDREGVSENTEERKWMRGKEKGEGMKRERKSEWGNRMKRDKEKSGREVIGRVIKRGRYERKEREQNEEVVTANWLKSQNGTLFSHVWRRGRLALDPLQNKSSFRVFLSGI